MKRYKIWFVVLLSLTVGCGSGQSTDREQQAGNLAPTETQEENALQTEEQKETPKRSEIVIQNTTTGQQPTPIVEEETDELLFAYEKFGGYVEDMCIAEDGTLYAICLWGEDKQYRLDEPIEITKSQQRLYAFDENGKRIWQMDVLIPSIPSADLSYLVTKDAIVEWADGYLYLVLRGVHKMPVLYRLHLETWEWQELYCFERFSQINKLVFLGERLYVHGLLANPKEKTMEQEIQRLTWSPDSYKGQAIGYMDMENLKAGVTLLPIDVPQDMIKLSEDTLGIYQMGEDAEYFWKYQPLEETWEKTDIAVNYYRSTLEKAEEQSALCEKFASYGEGCFYVKDFTNICYETSDGTEVLQFKNSDGFVYHLKSDGTFLYYYYHENANKGIRRIQIRDLLEHFATSEQSEIEKLVYTSDYLKNIDDIALTTDGRLYAIGLQTSNTVYNEEVLEITQAAQWLYEFDSNGDCVCVGKMLFSPGEAMVLEWSEDSLYMVVPGSNRMPVLYQVEHLSEVNSDVVQTVKKFQETDSDMNHYMQEYLAFRNLDMWTLQELYRFDMFSEINRLFFLGDRLYVHGTLEHSDEKSSVQNTAGLETDPNSENEQAVGYMDMKNLDAGITLLSIDGIPKDMIKLNEDTLGIYLAGENEASLWKYQPSENKWEQTDIGVVKYSDTAEKNVEETAVYGEFTAYEDGCFYVKDGHTICYKKENGTEQELFENYDLVHCLKTDGTFLYYYSKEWSAKEVWRIRISDLLEQEREK